MLKNSFEREVWAKEGLFLDDSLSLEFIVSPTSVDGKLRSVIHLEAGIEILKFAFVL